MEILSDISSVSAHSFDSMPPLIDRFGRIVLEEPDDRSTVTYEEAARIETPLNTHLYFDEDGNEIPYEEFVRLNEETEPEEDSDDEEPPWIRTPHINQKFILKHPRVMLAFLRFLDFYNELADPEEVFIIKAIPQSIIKRICEHHSVAQVPPEFAEDVEELKHRLGRHADLSELHWV
jgi:hypothetical protein